MSDYASILKRLNQLQQDSDQKKMKTWLNNNERIIRAISEKDVPFSELSALMTKLTSILDNDPKASQLRGFYSQLMRYVAKNYELVPPKYYQTQWMAIGMTVFGLPMGIAFAASIGNMAFLSIGLPLGLPIGLAVGQQKDKKALAEGKVLDM